MSKITVTIMGIGGAIPSIDSDTTYFAMESEGFSALIDCGGSPLLKIQKAGINPFDLDAVIITHRHPDHVYGLPSLLQGLGLIGRKKELSIFVVENDVSIINSLIEIFDLHPLVRSFLKIIPFPFAAEYRLYSDEGLTIHTTPVDHGVPTVALRLVNENTGGKLVYSSDTGPCDDLVSFASQSDILIHECNLPNTIMAEGHVNGRQAGNIARQVKTKRLVLVHLPVFEYNIQLCKEGAQSTFSGPVDIPVEFQKYVF